MKIVLKIFLLVFVGTLTVSNASGQANAFVNILTLNAGQVSVGSTVDLQVTVGNTGPVSDIGTNKLRVQISIPIAIASVLPTAQQTGLPAGWLITVNNGGTITICNGSDVIAVNTQRQIFIKVHGDAIGGPSTINANLLFSNGTSCTVPGTLAGDNTADNTSQSTIQVVQAPSCSLAGVTTSIGSITCNGGTTTLSATQVGATSAVEYSLNGGPFQASNTFTVTAGTYTVAVREVNTPACIATAPAVSVTNPPIVEAPVITTIVQPTCNLSTGAVSLDGLPAGNWIINPIGISGNTPTTTISGLVPGTYNFTVIAPSGCASPQSESAVIHVQPVTPAAPIVGTITQPTCTISTGSVVLSGLPAENWIINPGSIVGSSVSATIDNLNPGIYTFKVTNQDGCTSSPSSDVIINSVSGTLPAPTVNVTQPSCAVPTGRVIVTSDTAGLAFSLDGADFAPYLPNGYTLNPGSHTLTQKVSGGCVSPVANVTINEQPPTPNAPTVSVVHPTCTQTTGLVSITSDTLGLIYSVDDAPYAHYPADGYTMAPGTHTLTAKTGSGCISSITNITVNMQLPPPTMAISLDSIKCFGGVATLTITAVGGVPPYQFSLDGGNFIPVNIFFLGAGTYRVSVKDSNLCVTTDTLMVTQPPAFSLSASTLGAACNITRSTLILTTTGGAPPFQYSLNGGAFQNSNHFEVDPGTHVITARDANFCVTSMTTTVTQSPSLKALATAKRITQCGGTTLVRVTASGGTPPYSGLDSFVRGPGTWAFPVMDSGGCVDTAEITIEPPGCIDLKIFPNPSTNSINVYHSQAEQGSTMQVFDMRGALILSQAVPFDAFQSTINVSRLAVGAYIVMFLNGSDRKSALFEKINPH